ncbi:dockerin type I domain-containing protein [Mucisphaera calidilacus]|uniref:Dockerin domain-containing protein n=1 Tax=Mucisphaera calidilacus TaxID=2527982 RepID=A0A518BV14_9BACT|nr:dockerin type I domain-containing protein [Mucisphaera calidilacus]QDU70787.1 hypothetical protein Pan265_06240 [Mucisphaera calidilacus]
MRDTSGHGAPADRGRFEALESRVYFSAMPLESFVEAHGPGCCCGCHGPSDASDLTALHTHAEDDLIRLPGGYEIFHDSAPTADEIAAVTQVDALLSVPVYEGATFGLASVPMLSSLPSSDMTIYLDFNGHTTTDSRWNLMYQGGADFTTPAYSTDGDTQSFSDTELSRIEAIWGRVAEDFAPFDVNVTTVEPEPDDLIKSGAYDDRWGLRVVIGGGSHDWYRSAGQSAAGGVAYVGSFDWDEDAPVFVFENELANGNEKYTAETISHEVGHALGLRHHGTAGAEYYTGHDDWAPIMGNSFYKSVTQWSQGEYAGASRPGQDDVAIIGGGQEGVVVRADDYGDTIAESFSLGTGEVMVEGVITTRTDVDLFRIDAGDGTLSVVVDALGVQPNLNIGLRLYDAEGLELLAVAPGDSMDASLVYPVTEGVYYLEVDGVGTGDGVSGYTDYGSIGSYQLTASVPEVVILGDFTGDGMVDATDIDTLNHALATGSADALFDLDADGFVDSNDMDYLVEVVLGTSVGDANLDGVVNALDLSTLASAFGRSTTGWAQGDFNADGTVTLVDLSLLGSNWAGGDEDVAAMAQVATAQTQAVTVADAQRVTGQHQNHQQQVGNQRASLRASMWLQDDLETESLFGLWRGVA